MSAEKVFLTVDECRKAIEQLLALSSDRWRQPIAEGLADACERSPVAPHHEFALQVGRWVIRDEDLRLFQSIKGALLAAASAQFFLATPSVSAAAGVVLAMAEAALASRQHGSLLTPLQAAVVAAMKASGRLMLPDEIAELIGTQASSVELAATPMKVEKALHELEAIPTRAGLTKLVECQQSGRWLLRGV